MCNGALEHIAAVSINISMERGMCLNRQYALRFSRMISFIYCNALVLRTVPIRFLQMLRCNSIYNCRADRCLEDHELGSAVDGSATDVVGRGSNQD